MISSATTVTPLPNPQRDTLDVTPRAALEGVTPGVAQEKDFSLVGDGEISFWDFLDAINPLQHIPIINGIYRELTGDTIKPVMKLAGGTLFGGPLGLVLAAADVGLEASTGKDAGQHVSAMLESGEDSRGAAYRMYTEARSEDGWRDTSDAIAAAEAAMARLERPDTASRVASTAPTIVLPALPVTAEAAPRDAAAEPTLPPWDAPASAAPAATAPQGRAFPIPQRRNAHADSPRPLTDLRAAEAKPASSHLGAMPPGLSAAAMAAAGLTPEAVADVLKAHAKDDEGSAKPAKAKDDAPAARPKTPTAPPQTADASGEPLWFFDQMNQALDKYGAAQALHPATIGAAR